MFEYIDQHYERYDTLECIDVSELIKNDCMLLSYNHTPSLIDELKPFVHGFKYLSLVMNFDNILYLERFNYVEGVGYFYINKEREMKEEIKELIGGLYTKQDMLDDNTIRLSIAVDFIGDIRFTKHNEIHPVYLMCGDTILFASDKNKFSITENMLLNIRDAPYSNLYLTNVKKVKYIGYIDPNKLKNNYPFETKPSRCMEETKHHKFKKLDGNFNVIQEIRSLDDDYKTNTDCYISNVKCKKENENKPIEFYINKNECLMSTHSNILFENTIFNCNLFNNIYIKNVSSVSLTILTKFKNTNYKGLTARQKLLMMQENTENEISICLDKEKGINLLLNNGVYKLNKEEVIWYSKLDKIDWVPL